MLYKVALFLHVIGVIAMCAALVMEWLCVIGIKKSQDPDGIKASISNYAVLSKIGDAGVIFILIPGIYMAATVWGDASWIIASFAGLILLGIIGGAVTGRKMKKLKKVVNTAADQAAGTNQHPDTSPLWLSIQIRTFLFLGIIFLMTVKPGLIMSILALCIAAGAGFLPLSSKMRSPQVRGSSRM